MSFQVILLREAEEDLFAIYQFIRKNDSIRRAEEILASLHQSCLALRDLPERGHIPPELEAIGLHGYREIHFKPFRIIYEIESKIVFVHCIADGRRNMQELFEMRLLR